MKHFITLLIALLLGNQATSQTENVLFIGNSFTHMNALCKIYQNLANSKGKNVFADTIAVSGSTLKGHTERPNTYKKMKARSWDYVFIQAMSRELSYDSLTIATETIPYAKIIIDSVKTYNPCAKIYFYMTWGYRNGTSDTTNFESFVQMADRIEKGYMQMSKATGGYPVSPIGMVWKDVRIAYPDLNLYEPDNFHPNPNGSLIAASTFYAAIYRESPVGGTAPKKVDPTVAKNIQQVAWDFVRKNYSKYNLDTVQIAASTKIPKMDFTAKPKWLSVTFTNKSAKGLDVKWDFGDGNTSTKTNPKYYYQKPGKYTITLSVKSGCQWYTIKKVVTVSNRTTTKKKTN